MIEIKNESIVCSTCCEVNPSDKWWIRAAKSTSGYTDVRYLICFTCAAYRGFDKYIPYEGDIAEFFPVETSLTFDGSLWGFIIYDRD